VEQYLLGKASLNREAADLTQNGASFRIHYWGVMPSHYNTSLHQHSFMEICYVLKGKGMYINDGQTYSIQKDTLFLSKPNILHQIKSEEGLFLLYVGFELVESASNVEWMNLIQEVKDCSEIHLKLEEMNAIVLLWQSLLMHSTKNDQVLYKAILENTAFSLIATLIQAFCPPIETSKPVNVNETPSELLSTVKIYIKDNLSQALLLADVAGHFHISGRHLSRLFQSGEGVNYSTYIQNERIQKAATLLKSTDQTIKDIAEGTGFSSVHYFTRVFTEKLGCSPGAFRTLYTDVKKMTYRNENDFTER
jgi:YesN/AraC family two-component response regulator